MNQSSFEGESTQSPSEQVMSATRSTAAQTMNQASNGVSDGESSQSPSEHAMSATQSTATRPPLKKLPDTPKMRSAIRVYYNSDARLATQTCQYCMDIRTNKRKADNFNGLCVMKRDAFGVGTKCTACISQGRSCDGRCKLSSELKVRKTDVRRRRCNCCTTADIPR